MTEREMIAWLLFWKEEDTKTTMDQWYSAQISLELFRLRRQLNKQSCTATLKDMLLRLESTPTLTREQAADLSRSVWAARLGRNV